MTRFHFDRLQIQLLLVERKSITTTASKVRPKRDCCSAQVAFTHASQEVLEALLQDALDWLKPSHSQPRSCRSADEYRVKAEVCWPKLAFLLVTSHHLC
jgi:hypothetical protein